MMWGRLYKNGPRAAANTQPSGPFSGRHACASWLRGQPLGNHQPQLLLFHHGHVGSVSHLCCGNHHGVGSSEDGKWVSVSRLSFLIYIPFSPERQRWESTNKSVERRGKGIYHAEKGRK